MRVLIIGGGLSGSLLAHGLQRSDIDVRLFERNPSTHDELPGFGLHLNGNGIAALRAWLPPELMQHLDEQADHIPAFERFCDEQLRLLASTQGSRRPLPGAGRRLRTTPPPSRAVTRARRAPAPMPP